MANEEEKYLGVEGTTRLIERTKQLVLSESETIILSAQGDGTSPIICKRSATNNNIVGLYAEGKSEQYISPNLGNADASKKQGNEYVFKDIWNDGSFLRIECVKPSKTLTMSYEAKASSDDTFYYKLEYTDGTLSSTSGLFNATTSYTAKVKILTEPKEVAAIRIGINHSQYTAYARNIMLNEGTSALPYESFTGLAPTPTNPIPIKDASGVVEANTKNIVGEITKNNSTVMYENTLIATFPSIEKGKTYTISFDSDANSVLYSNENITNETRYNINVGHNILLYTVAKDLDKNNSAQYMNGWRLLKQFNNSGVTLTNVMIEEGTTASPYVEYKSNAINIGYINCQFENNKLYYGSNGNIGHIAQYGASVDLMKVKPNTTYTLELVTSGAINITGFIYFDKNRTFISSVDINSQKKKIADFTTPINCEYVALDIYDPNKSINVAELDKALLSETDSPLHIELRSIPNTNIADTLTVNEDGSGEWVQKVLVYDMSANADNLFNYWETSTSGYEYCLRTNFRYNIPWVDASTVTEWADKYSLMCNNFEYTQSSPHLKEKSCIFIGHPENTELYMSFYELGLKTQTAQREWLKSHQTYVYIPIKEPIVHQLTKEQVDAIRQLKTYEGTTLIDSELALKEIKYLKQCEVVDALKIIKGWFYSLVEKEQSDFDYLNARIASLSGNQATFRVIMDVIPGEYISAIFPLNSGDADKKPLLFPYENATVEQMSIVMTTDPYTLLSPLEEFNVSFSTMGIMGTDMIITCKCPDDYPEPMVEGDWTPVSLYLKVTW